MSYYTRLELEKIGFKFIGKDVKISRKASFYNASNICIGDYSRVDDFCVLSAGGGGITIGRYVHIAVYSSLIGEGSITMKDYSCLSSKCSVYSSNDDYSGEYMSNPTLPKHLTNVESENVLIKEHSLVGSGSIVLPGCTIEENVSVGALSLVKTSLQSGYIYAGNPLKCIRTRSKNCIELAKTL